MLYPMNHLCIQYRQLCIRVDTNKDELNVLSLCNVHIAGVILNNWISKLLEIIGLYVATLL